MRLFCKLNIKNLQFVAGLIAVLTLLPPLTLAANLLGDDKDLLWESGVNLRIALAKQDKSPGGKTLPNSHPVALNAKDITDALSGIEFWEKEGILKSAEENTVFSISQARLLGNFLSQGLAKARPDQDIVFVLANLKKGSFGIKNKVYMAGRAFYLDNKLHIIIGDYDRSGDKGMEAAAGGAGITEVQYYFTTGSRSSASGFKKTVVSGNGIDVYSREAKKRRLDWLVIDVPAAAAAYVAKTTKKEPSGGADAAAIHAETEKLAKERREMRAEMARMRKEMSGSANSGGQLSTEERLSELDELHKKKLISDEEYEQKRKEILDDI